MASGFCTACRRPLTDAESVRLEMGPVCRAKLAAEHEGDVPDDCTMTDPAMAAASLRAVATRILENADRRTFCGCGTPIRKGTLVAVDHDGEGGYLLAGFAKSQWLAFRCPKCGFEMAAWKVTNHVDTTGLDAPMEGA